MKTSPPGTSDSADETVGTYYDDPKLAAGLASAYSDATALGEFYRSRMRRIATLLADVEGDLLDAGCGTGQMLRFLRDVLPGRFSLTGLDRSASVIGVARDVVDDESVRLVVGRMEALPFEDATFDVVLAMGSLEYVASMEEALAELARVTRPGGRAIVTMQNRWSPYRLWDALVWSRIVLRMGGVESPIVRRVGEGDLRRALGAAGITPTAVVHYNFNVLLAPLDARFPGLAIRLEHAIERLARGPLCRLGADYIVVGGRSGPGVGAA